MYTKSLKTVLTLVFISMSFLNFSFMLTESTNAKADDAIAVKVDSLSNIKGNGAMEACGTAIHKDGIKPLMVTLKHDESYYTVLTGANGKWCLVLKRWTFNGKVEASATTLQNPDITSFQAIEVKEQD
ncbi:MAG: hypothetical protein HY072_05515 [Deltaproteobacteria bacterium]|nr:hypothetical protein [Deltaproteobacteria bacterium]